MNNHPLINPETGKEEWISRAIAILAIVLGIDKNGIKYVLGHIFYLFTFNCKNTIILFTFLLYNYI